MLWILRCRDQCRPKKLANVMQILYNSIKCPTTMRRSFYSFQFGFLQGKKEKFVKAFLFKILTLDYDRCKGSLRP